jgi:hypothetical protein
VSSDQAVPAEADGEDGAPAPEEDAPDWWHRDHPTFSALAGFFTGLLYVALVPALWAGLVGLVAGRDRAEELFPFVLVTLVVPLVLVINQRTRRFGTYFFLGIVLTAVVVIGVAALVLWFLVSRD